MDPFDMHTWLFMRPTVSCAYCGRRGRVQRRMGWRSFIEHHCPGPFVLAGAEEDPDYVRAGFRLTLFPRGSRGVGVGGDVVPVVPFDA